MFHQIQDQGFDIVGDFEEFQQTYDKTRGPSMGSQRTRQTRAESLQYSMMNTQAKEESAVEPVDKAPEKPVLDLSKYKQEQLNNVAKLKVETRLKQLNDYTFSKGCKWRKIFLSANDNYDFFSYLDEQIKLQKKLHPGRVNGQVSPKNSDIVKTKAANSSYHPSGLSNKFKTVDLDAPAKSLGSKMIRKRQMMDKRFAERKTTEFP